MQITCDGCGAKIRVPDAAAGKRVKCPKCANPIRVPALDHAKDDPDAKETKVSAKPMPPPPPIEEEPLDDDEKTKVTSSGAKPPKIKSKPARSMDDEDDADEDDRPRRKRRRMDEDEDDYLDVRSDRRPKRRGNTQASTAMSMGIASVSLGAIGLCCCTPLFESLAGIFGVVAIVLGIMAKQKSNDNRATIGLICGAIGIVLAVLGMILWIFVLGFQLNNMGNMNFNQPNGGRRRF